ncbi:MAG: Uma2 family endonuclease [Pirellulaceae bacterium]
MESSLLELVSVPPEAVRRFTVDEYHAMIQAGILTQDDPYELIEGWLVPKMTRNAPHDLCVQRLQRMLMKVLPSEWLCFVQSAVTLTDGEPEPDIAVVRGPDEQYATRHPHGPDIAMVAEVADSSLVRDRDTKFRSYARANIPVYWIANISADVLEVYTQPGVDQDGEPTYLIRHDFQRTDVVAVVIAGNPFATVKVSELLP